jgi:hypothetical protein
VDGVTGDRQRHIVAVLAESGQLFQN